MKATAPVIKLEGVTRIYDDHGVPVSALRGVDLEVGSGEFAAIVGPSGSGKTTLLNIIGCLDAPTEGRVLIEGIEVTKLPSSKLIELRLRRIGFVFQAYNLIPVLTALENVEFTMLLQGIPRRQRRERARAILAAVGLADQLHRKPTELSGGQQQRVAVARALASEPAFVLADEPTANLDTEAAGHLLDLMEKMNREKGTTFLFSTHDPRVVARARRVIALRDGLVISDEIHR